ncbi:MAG: hypothetical protein PUE81_05645 [Lachnospiraceae bacterium]|nr:hypothetical protein [Lachnospiraceae bacterium]
MAKKDRTGNRKSREQRKQFKVQELGFMSAISGKNRNVLFQEQGSLNHF